MTPSYRDVLVAQGVTHHWPLEEISGTTSSALSGGVTMTINNPSGMLGARGVVGNGMAFTTNSSGQSLTSSATSSAAFDGNGSFSCSWIMSYVAEPGYHGIVCKRVAASTTTHFAVFLYDGDELYLDLGRYQVRWNTGWKPTSGVWYHCAFVYDKSATTQSLYINGQLQVTRTIAAPTGQTDDAPMSIGYLMGNTYTSFSGTLDEIALFVGKALSASEVLAQYRTVFPIHWVYDGTKWASGNRRVITAFAGETPVVDFMTYGTSQQMLDLNPADMTSTEARTIYTVHTVANLPNGDGVSVEPGVGYGYSALNDSTPNRFITFRYNSGAAAAPDWRSYARYTGGGGLGHVPANSAPVTGRYCSVWGYSGGNKIFIYAVNDTKIEATVAGLIVPHEKIAHYTPGSYQIRSGGIRTVIFRGEHDTTKIAAVKAALLVNTPTL